MNLHSLLNVLLLLYLASFPLLLYLNKKIFKGKNKNFNKSLKIGRKIHPYVGVVLIISGSLHGFLKLGGSFILHTGSLLIIALMINGVIGFIYRKSHNRTYAKTHRILGVIVVGLFILHYVNPWLLSRLF